MKIDKLGFYKSRDGHEIEIVFIDRHGKYDFIAVGRLHLEAINSVNFVTYTCDDGEIRDDGDRGDTLIEYLRPSGVEWPTPRKTSFVAYLDEDSLHNFDIKDPTHICYDIENEKAANRLMLETTSKVSKWRFYGEELLGE